MYYWDKPEYTYKGAKVYDTPEEQKKYKISKDSRSVNERLEAFVAEIKKEEPLVVRT